MRVASEEGRGTVGNWQLVTVNDFRVGGVRGLLWQVATSVSVKTMAHPRYPVDLPRPRRTTTTNTHSVSLVALPAPSIFQQIQRN